MNGAPPAHPLLFFWFDVYITPGSVFDTAEHSNQKYVFYMCEVMNGVFLTLVHHESDYLRIFEAAKVFRIDCVQVVLRDFVVAARVVG